MCGLTGFANLSQGSLKNSLRVIKNMTAALSHRGPDDQGIWSDPATGISIGHRRLSIVDLSKAAHQPMLSKDERYVLAFNGEIHNFKILREKLKSKGVRFKGTGDTEVLLEHLIAEGTEATLSALHGMFAFVLWDKVEKTLTLARDPFGIKPLYFGFFEDEFIFASEVKAFFQHPYFKKEINQSSLASYFQFGFIPAPHSIFNNVEQLKPGHFLQIKNDGSITCKRYYHPKKETTHSSYQTSKEALEKLLHETVEQTLSADVETGVFLSGGIDSSLVAAIASRKVKKLQTFSIGFHESDYDESARAKQIADHLGTQHHQHILDEENTLRLLPKLFETFDEPFADISALAGMALAEFTKQHVKTALSGDGGDEGFMGYNRYIWSRSPLLQNPLILNCASILPLNHIPFLPNQMNEKINKLQKMSGAKKTSEKYFSLLEKWPSRSITESTPHHYQLKDTQESLPEAFNTHDLSFYLPNDVLTKVDRTSMAFGLEVRVPLLDHNIVEFGRNLPTDHKIKGRKGKLILRDILQSYIPENAIATPKSGFAVPIGKWMTSSLKDQSEEYFKKEALENAGLKADPILKKWNTLKRGNTQHQHQLWTIMMWMMWKDKYL